MLLTSTGRDRHRGAGATRRRPRAAGRPPTARRRSDPGRRSCRAPARRPGAAAARPCRPCFCLNSAQPRLSRYEPLSGIDRQRALDQRDGLVEPIAALGQHVAQVVQRGRVQRIVRQRLAERGFGARVVLALLEQRASLKRHAHVGRKPFGRLVEHPVGFVGAARRPGASRPSVRCACTSVGMLGHGVAHHHDRAVLAARLGRAHAPRARPDRNSVGRRRRAARARSAAWSYWRASR